MARNGNVTIPNMVVREVLHGETRSRVILRSANGNFTISIESTPPFPADMNLRPADTVDFKIEFDK
jgi:hypothetical protein